MHNNNINLNELEKVKTLYLLDKRYNIFSNIDINLKGDIYHKRKDKTQDVPHYIIYKFCKELKITNIPQLLILIDVYKPDFIKSGINLNYVINYYSKKVFNINNNNTKKSAKILSNLLKKNKLSPLNREIFIKKYGVKTFTITEDFFNKCYFNKTNYGFIDYYKGIIINTDLNFHNLIPILLKGYDNGLKYYKTDNNGFLQIKFIYNSKTYLKYYDLRHINTTFKLWVKKSTNDSNIIRLYISDYNYLSLNVNKQGQKIISNYF